MRQEVNQLSREPCETPWTAGTVGFWRFGVPCFQTHIEIHWFCRRWVTGMDWGFGFTGGFQRFLQLHAKHADSGSDFARNKLMLKSLPSQQTRAAFHHESVMRAPKGCLKLFQAKLFFDVELSCLLRCRELKCWTISTREKSRSLFLLRCKATELSISHSISLDGRILSWCQAFSTANGLEPSIFWRRGSMSSIWTLDLTPAAPSRLMARRMAQWLDGFLKIEAPLGMLLSSHQPIHNQHQTIGFIPGEGLCSIPFHWMVLWNILPIFQWLYG